MNASSCVFPHKYVSSPTDKFRKLCGFKEKRGCLSKKCVIFKTQVAISALVKHRPESCRLEAICTYHDTLQKAWVPGQDSGSHKSCRGLGSQCTLELTVHKYPGRTTPLFFFPSSKLQATKFPITQHCPFSVGRYIWRAAVSISPELLWGDIEM